MTWEKRRCPVCKRNVSYDTDRKVFLEHRERHSGKGPWCGNSEDDVFVADPVVTHTPDDENMSVKATSAGLPTHGRKR